MPNISLVTCMYRYQFCIVIIFCISTSGHCTQTVILINLKMEWQTWHVSLLHPMSSNTINPRALEWESQQKL